MKQNETLVIKIGFLGVAEEAIGTAPIVFSMDRNEATLSAHLAFQAASALALQQLGPIIYTLIEGKADDR